MVVDTLKRAAPSTGHTDNQHGVPTYWGKSGNTLQKLITTVATTDFLLFGFDVSLSMPFSWLFLVAGTRLTTAIARCYGRHYLV